MKTYGRNMLVVAAVVAAMSVPSQGGSLWEKSQRKTLALHNDDTARAVGDMLTIVINERSVITNETKRDMDKSSDRSATVTGNIKALDKANDATGNLFNLTNLDVSSSAQTQFKGNAKFDSSRSVTDEITVIVQDVLPNGYLVVLGTRQRQIHGDVEIIEISGIVRPSDVNFANSVASEKIADFRIAYRQKGQENNFTKPGWLGRILNFLSPY